jgi:hypothetical protein
MVHKQSLCARFLIGFVAGRPAGRRGCHCQRHPISVWTQTVHDRPAQRSSNVSHNKESWNRKVKKLFSSQYAYREYWDCAVRPSGCPSSCPILGHFLKDQWQACRLTGVVMSATYTHTHTQRSILLASLLTYLLTYLLIYLLVYLLTYLLACLLTYLLT